METLRASPLGAALVADEFGTIRGLITLEDLARRVNVSARTIDRHLKKEGLGFRELSDKVRFERACEMLCAEGASIVDVALRLGFSDAANFSRAFKRVIGVSPGEYQKTPG